MLDLLVASADCCAMRVVAGLIRVACAVACAAGVAAAFVLAFALGGCCREIAHPFNATTRRMPVRSPPVPRRFCSVFTLPFFHAIDEAR